MCGLMVLLVDCRNGKREDRTCAELFSPGDGCSGKTGRIIKTGAKTGLDYKSSRGGRTTSRKLGNKWKKKKLQKLSGKRILDQCK